MKRVIVYIDGFNLYYGLRASGWKSLYWLDVRKLAAGLVRSGQRLVGVKYFTSRIREESDKRRRQSTFLDALDAIGGIDFFWGHYASRSSTCDACGASRSFSSEKKTDVNIATQLLLDAFDDRFDIATIVSGDGDLLAPIQAVPARFPGKLVWVSFPPNRSNRDLERAAGGKVRIRRKLLERCQLPDLVVTSGGVELVRPDEWRKDR